MSALNNPRRLFSVVGLLSLWAWHGVEGADLRNVLTEYTVTAWSDRDGLPRGTIWALAQDAQGYLWIGSEHGLVRFDGLRFATWEALGNAPLPNEAVRALCVSRDGSLWVGFGNTAGVARIQGRSVRVFGAEDGVPPAEVTSLVEDKAGILWAAHSSGLHRYVDGRWSPQPDIKGRVRRVYVNRAGHVYAINDLGLFARTSPTAPFAAVSPPIGFITGLQEDASGVLWATDAFVGMRPIGRPSPPSGDGTYGIGNTMLTDREGNLWLGTTGQGVWRRGSATGAVTEPFGRVTTLTGLSNDIVVSLIEDRDGSIWVGTAAGLNRLTKQPLAFIARQGVVLGLEPGTGGTVWAAAADGLLRLGLGGERMIAAGVQVRAMHADRTGALWVATDQGVVRYSGDVNISATLVMPTARRVRGISSDSRGGIWVYDLDDGVLRWDGKGLEAVALPPQFDHALICAIHADRSGRLWVGFRQERVVAVGADRKVAVYGPAEGLDSGTCTALHEDPDGAVWVLGVHGLGRFKQDRFVTLGHPGDIPLESLSGMTEDAAGQLWISSQASVMRIERQAFSAMFDTPDPRVIPQVDNPAAGLSGTSARAGRSIVHTSDGRLWLLTSRGVALAEPASIRTEGAPAPVKIDSAAVDDRLDQQALPTSLPPGVRRVEIDYSLPDLAPGPTPRFRYRMDGFDTEWREAGPNQRRVTYTNLPPRDYTFRVEALSGAGGPTISTDLWQFSVQPAFYQTTWFLAVGLVVTGGLASVAWRQRLRKVRGEFAVLLKERVRLSREIHDTLLQSLIGVSLQLEQVEHDAEASPAGRARLVQARRQVEEYIREARESIWNLRSSALERQGLVATLRHAGERAFTGATEFQLTVSGDDRRCAPESEAELLRIGQEAVINAAHHAEAAHVSMELRYSDEFVTLTVRDDGRGFDSTASEAGTGSHIGLVAMRERAESVGGELRISSTPGRGTVVEAKVPRNASHQ
jgi:ligand-binding sensor domain-containing protein/two-component sensor histidine kinase